MSSSSASRRPGTGSRCARRVIAGKAPIAGKPIPASVAAADRRTAGERLSSARVSAGTAGTAWPPSAASSAPARSRGSSGSFSSRRSAASASTRSGAPGHRASVDGAAPGSPQKAPAPLVTSRAASRARALSESRRRAALCAAAASRLRICEARNTIGARTTAGSPAKSINSAEAQRARAFPAGTVNSERGPPARHLGDALKNAFAPRLASSHAQVAAGVVLLHEFRHLVPSVGRELRLSRDHDEKKGAEAEEQEQGQYSPQPHASGFRAGRSGMPRARDHSKECTRLCRRSA